MSRRDDDPGRSLIGIGMVVVAMLGLGQYLQVDSSRRAAALTTRMIAGQDSMRAELAAAAVDRRRGIVAMDSLRGEFAELLAQGRERSIENQELIRRTARAVLGELHAFGSVVDSLRAPAKKGRK